MASQSPAERLFTLTCCLMAAPRIGLSKQDIFESVPGYVENDNDEALERQFERDKKALRELGVQLEVVNFGGSEDIDAQRYRVELGDFSWPDELELSAEQMGLLELAGRAWNTKQFALSARAGIGRLKSRGMVESSRELGFIAPRILARHASFEPLATASAENEIVLIDYRKSDGSQSVREVAPLRLRLVQGEWVLLAQEKGEIKNFLLRRIVAKGKGTGKAFSNPSEESIAAAEEDLIRFTQSQVAKLSVIADSEAFWHFGGYATEVELNFMDEALLAEDLLEFGPDVEVLSPQTLKQRIQQSLRKVVSDHA